MVREAQSWGSAGVWPFALAGWPRIGEVLLHELMTRDQIQTAINEGIPFDIKMADGAKSRVHQRY